VNLDPLTPEQTEALMRSVFGEVANLQLCAGRIHALAQGSPRTSMELAQHLVARGLARYEAGGWLLPAQLDESDLPKTLSESLLRRLDALSADARELAEALCITEGYQLSLDSYRSLSTHRNQDRIFIALEALVAARILVASAESYRFSQRGFLATLQATMSAKWRTTLHSRFANLLTTSGSDVLQRAHHLLHGGREANAIQLLCSVDLLAKSPPLLLLEGALAYALKDSSLSARSVHQLSIALLLKAAVVLAVDSFRQHLPRVLEQLRQDSGLALYAQLAELPADGRLSQALAQQQQRYLATPEHERVHGVSDAVRELVGLTGATCAMAGSMFDLELIETLPSLEPLFPLSAALPVASQMSEACREWIAGRGLRAMQLYEQVLTRLSEPDRGGMDPSQYDRARLGVHYGLALMEASLGIERAEERARILEADRRLRVGAWRVRMLLHLNQGGAEAARKCARRAELLQLQDGTESHYLGTSAGFEMRACDLAEDLLGVKSALDSLGVLVEKHPGWRPMQILGQSRYRELQGDLKGALELLLPGFDLARPGRHLLFGFMAAAHVRILRGLDDTQAALAHAQRYIAISEREQLTTCDRMLRMELALTLARVGQHEPALKTIDALIETGEALGSTGLVLGVFYEARARIAIAMGERACYESSSAQSAREYQKGRNSALSAKFAHLLEDGRRRGLTQDDPANEAIGLSEAEPETEYNTVSSRIIECVDGPDRARCALTMLLQSTDAYLGYLYGVEDTELTPLAGLPELRAEESLERWLQQWVLAEHELASQAPITLGTATVSEPPPLLGENDSETLGTCSQDPAARHEVPAYYSDVEGRRFKAVLLVGELESERRIAAVLALQVTSRQYARPSEHLLSQIADQLLENGDVAGVLLAT
jgi:hypothetical protein